jgi:staphylococcal nuclease domain-containing protein 1
LKNGWVKLKELKRDSEEDHKKREFETEAKTAGKGLWNPHGPKATTFCLLLLDLR